MFLIVTASKAPLLLTGLGVALLLVGVRLGLPGLLVATSYVGKSSDIGVRAGVRTAVLYEGVRERAAMS